MTKKGKIKKPYDDPEMKVEGKRKLNDEVKKKPKQVRHKRKELKKQENGSKSISQAKSSGAYPC